MVSGGLAIRLRNAFRTRAVIVHARHDAAASLGMRGTALLHMLASSVEQLRITSSEFKWKVPAMKDCVVLRESECVTDAAL